MENGATHEMVACTPGQAGQVLGLASGLTRASMLTRVRVRSTGPASGLVSRLPDTNRRAVPALPATDVVPVRVAGWSPVRSAAAVPVVSLSAHQPAAPAAFSP